ncbi:MAG: hypothetical protein IJR99_09580 [Kiritimatiellae bacterium]|nr:hypothetical protein [Kiritimatiellia bacterium]
MVDVCTVLVTRKKDGTPVFDSYPPVSGKGEGEGRVVVTNDMTAFSGITREVVPIVDLCRLANPLQVVYRETWPSEEGAPSSGESLFRFWRQLEEKLLEFPLWALDAITQVYRDLEEPAACRLLQRLAGIVKSRGKNCGSWPESFPAEMLSRNDKRRLPELSDCTPLNTDRIAGYFEPGGAFSRLMPGYESRRGQVAMARAVAGAFSGGKHLLVEAGTGVGKSLAYLIPAASWAVLNDVPVVVSTNTRNLQSQLITHDLPVVRKALQLQAGVEDADPAQANAAVPLRVALLKGRTNYFCLHRLESLLEDGTYDLERSEQRVFIQLIAWLCKSSDGDLDSFPYLGKATPAFLSKLVSTGEECPGRSCRYYRRCFLQRARIRASYAHVIVANHALVFAEIQMPGSILPPFSQVVFDEAHNLEDVATRHLSLELSAHVVTRMLHRMSRGKGVKRSGTLENVQRAILKGGISGRGGHSEAIRKKFQSCRRALEKIRQSGKLFFECLSTLLPGDENMARFRTVSIPTQAPVTGADGGTGPVERQVCRRGMFLPCSQENWDEEQAAVLKFNFREAVAGAAKELLELAEMMRQVQRPDELPLYNDQVAVIEGEVKTLHEFEFTLNFVFAASDPEHVFWLERDHDPHRKNEVNAFSAPLSIGTQLAELLYKTKHSVVFSSATLRVGDSFRFIMDRLGIGLVEAGRVVTCLAESPFNYLMQCQTLTPNFLPPPGARENSNGYVEQLSALLLDVFTRMRGHALALFTSYEMMRQVARQVESQLEEEGIRLLVHGKDGTRDELLRIFCSGIPAVLFGVHSFWEGVDVPGDSLRLVVICRLPFAQVGDPILEARCEQIQQAGGSPFREFSLPQAVIKFRQGFGRLIRTKSDRGIVMITDSRIVTTGYGATFRKSLPCSVFSVDRQQLLSRIEEFFADAGGDKGCG